MKKAILYFYLFTKRQLKKGSFVLILLLFPLFTFFFSQSSHSGDAAVRTALFTSDSPLSGTTVEKLTAKAGIFQFYTVSSAAELYQDVATGKAQCGYLFPADLTEKLDRGKRSGLITVAVSPDTTMDKIINEVVYAELFEEYSLHLLKNYMADKSMLADQPQPELSERVDQLYRQHMSDGSTFAFSYSNDHQPETVGSSPERETVSFLTAPVRGLIAVFIFLAGFCGAINYYNDVENHIFDNRTQKNRQLLKLLSVSVPILLTGIMGGFCIFFAGLGTGVLKELAGLFFYSCGIILFCSLLSTLVKKKVFFCSLIPVFLLGSLLFTPVFLDLAVLFPAMKPLSLLFPPYYYLIFF